MEDLIKKLKELKDSLEKGMNNVGLGGLGSVKSGVVLPTISKLPKPGNNSLAGKVKIPNTTPTTKKNPIKSAEQTQNKDIKDLKMKEAQAQLVMKPMVKQEQLSIEKNGQWKLEDMDKSEVPPTHEGTFHGQVHERITERGERTVKFPKQKPDGSVEYGAKKIPNKVKVVHTWDHDKKQWNHKETTNLVNSHVDHGHSGAKSPMDIAREKANKQSEPKTESKVKTIRRKLEDIKKAIEDIEKSGYKGYTAEDNIRRKASNIGDTDIQSMPRIKQYGGSGVNAAAKEAAKMKAKSKKNPVKTYSPEEIKALNEKQS